jgi:hypothetical protein
MITSLREWLVVLRDLQTLIAFPLIVAGLILMLFGWRLWKPCVSLSFAIVGAMAATIFARYQGSDADLLFVGICALVFASVTYYFARAALPMLGGLIGAGIVWELCGEFRMDGLMQWVLTAAAFIAACGLSLINRRYLIIGITGFLGAVVFMSGVAALIMSMGSLYSTVQSMAVGSALVVPFLLLVPSVMSFFYQVSEVRRVQAEL